MTQSNRGCFPKGVLSTPKPIKKGQHLSPDTEFKKGIVPKNKLPVGSETIRQQTGDSPRAWVKVAEPNVWMPRAVHVWLSNGGTIGDGFVIHHRNEDTLDDRIENLECVKRSRHAEIHRTKISGGIKGKKLPCKNVRCGRCNQEFQGKKEGSFCHDCQEETRRESRRSYKKRLRSTTG